MVDIRFEKHGSFWLARYLTDAGASWLEEHVDTCQTWGETAVVVERKHVQLLAAGARRNGLAVEIV
jgi:hypothetical protein